MNFPDDAFPQWVTLLGKVYAPGAMGGAPPTDSAPVLTVRASVQPGALVSGVRTEQAGVQTEEPWWVYTGSKPASRIDDAVIYHEGALSPTAVNPSGPNVFTSMVWRGDWSSSIAYARGDVVRVWDTGGFPAYFYAIQPSTNQQPSNAAFWSTSRLFSARGPAADAFDGTGVLWAMRCSEFTN